MKNIYINGLGLIHPMISGEEETTQEAPTNIMGTSKQCTIPSFYSSRKLRRLDRLTTLCLYTALKAIDNEGDFDPYEVGTIYNSVYGCLNTSLKFGEYVISDNYLEASPTVFANTVINACIGHICKEIGLKGYSTMFSGGSNYVGYGMQLIRSGKAKSVLAGGVEEYNEELFKAFEEKEIKVSEGASTLLLSEKYNEDTYGEICSYSEINLLGHPCFTEEFVPNKEDIKFNIDNVLKQSNIKASDVSTVITASNHHNFLEAELSIINETFSNIKPIIHPKKHLFDTLGASLGFSLAMGALILKDQNIPSYLGNSYNINDSKIEYVLVNDFSISGNYTSFVLKAKDRGK